MNIFQFIFLLPVVAFFGCAAKGPAKINPNQHLEAVACDPQYEAEQILAQKKLIPAEVFHFSRKEILTQDLKDRRFSEKSWEASLTGGDDMGAGLELEIALFGVVAEVVPERPLDIDWVVSCPSIRLL